MREEKQCLNSRHLKDKQQRNCMQGAFKNKVIKDNNRSHFAKQEHERKSGFMGELWFLFCTCKQDIKLKMSPIQE